MVLGHAPLYVDLTAQPTFGASRAVYTGARCVKGYGERVLDARRAREARACEWLGGAEAYERSPSGTRTSVRRRQPHCYLQSPSERPIS